MAGFTIRFFLHFELGVLARSSRTTHMGKEDARSFLPGIMRGGNVCQPEPVAFIKATRNLDAFGGVQ